MKSTTKATFNADVISANKTVLLDVWAPWCAPCRAMNPILEMIDKDMSDKVEIIKLDASVEMELVQQLGVTSLPTFLAYNSGKITGSIVGATSRANLEKIVS